MKKQILKKAIVGALVMITTFGSFRGVSAQTLTATVTETETAYETANGGLVDAIRNYLDRQKNGTKILSLPTVTAPKLESVLTPPAASVTTTEVTTKEETTVGRVSENGVPLPDDPAQQRDIDAIVELIREEGVLSGDTTEEILLKIHDYLCRTITYNKSLTGKHIRTLYGALILKDAVCVGYAFAFAYLCEQAGISCRTQISENGEHIWNVVELDGEDAYCVDVTWDDPDACDNAGNAYICYDNFLIRSSELERNGESHVAGRLGSYGSFSDKNGFWEHNGYKQSAFSIEDLIAAFDSQYRSGRNVLQVRYTDVTAYEQARHYLFDNSLEGTWEVLRHIGQLYDGEYVNYYGNDSTLTINVFLNA